MPQSLSLGNPATLGNQTINSTAILSFLKSLGPITRLLSLAAFLTSLSSTIPFLKTIIIQRLALIPQNTIGKFYIWNVATAGFTEVDLFGVVNAGIVAVLGGWLEPVWGSAKLAVFVVVVNVLAGMGTYVQLLMVYVVTRYSQAM